MDKDENLTEEEKARRGLELLGLLAAMGAAKKQERSWDPLTKLEKDMYDSYIKAGFTPEQALRLSEAKSNLLISKYLPSVDDLDPRFK